MGRWETVGAKGQATTIAVNRTTKARLDKNRAPGQSYNGFIYQLIDLWEKVSEEETSYLAVATGRRQAQ